jgi:hypothetical protein
MNSLVNHNFDSDPRMKERQGRPAETEKRVQFADFSSSPRADEPRPRVLEPIRITKRHPMIKQLSMLPEESKQKFTKIVKKIIKTRQDFEDLK